MHLQTPLLWCFLLLGVLSPSFVVTAQQRATVNLRPRVVESDAGLPAVQATVDRRRVPLGDIVTFTLTPASAINNPRYVIILRFGDNQQQVVRTSEVPHLYRATGTYTFSVVVKSTGSKGGPTQPLPLVTLSAAPTPIDQGQSVNFAAQLSHGYPNIQYRFFYGDGGSSSWQDSSRSNYTYTTAGIYRAYVDIGVAGRQFGGSTRKAVEVKAQSLTVSLTANPALVTGLQPVKFFASASPANSTTRYRFAFGDSRFTAWQNSSQTTHVYNRAGNYRAYVEAAQLGRNATATSMPAMIGVQRSPSPAPTQRTSPRPTPTPTPTSSPSPAVSPSPDNGSSPSPSPTSSSSPVGSTSPSPNGSSSPGGTPSPDERGTPVIGDVKSSPSPSAVSTGNGSNQFAGWFDPKRDWWKYLIIAALILFLLYQASGMLSPPQPAFAAFSDPGTAVLAEDRRGVPLDFQLVLNSNVSSGAYAVETDEPSFVRNAPSLEERQILEI